jgi:hypothetical protein
VVFKEDDETDTLFVWLNQGKYRSGIDESNQGKHMGHYEEKVCLEHMVVAKGNRGNRKFLDFHMKGVCCEDIQRVFYSQAKK